MFILKKHTHSRHTWHSSNRYTVNSLKKHTHLTHTSKSVYSVHLVQSFGLWRGMCPGSPVDTISVFRVESVRHGREINYQPSKLLCYVHFEKTYTFKTLVTFFGSVYCESCKKHTHLTHTSKSVYSLPLSSTSRVGQILSFCWKLMYQNFGSREYTRHKTSTKSTQFHAIAPKFFQIAERN